MLSILGTSQNRTVRFEASASSSVNGRAGFSFPVSANFPSLLQCARSSMGIKRNQALRKLAEITEILPCSEVPSGWKQEGCLSLKWTGLSGSPPAAGSSSAVSQAHHQVAPLSAWTLVLWAVHTLLWTVFGFV